MRITVVVMYATTKEATIVYDIIQTTSENNKPIIISNYNFAESSQHVIFLFWDLLANYFLIFLIKKRKK